MHRTCMRNVNRGHLRLSCFSSCFVRVMVHALIPHSQTFPQRAQIAANPGRNHTAHRPQGVSKRRNRSAPRAGKSLIKGRDLLTPTRTTSPGPSRAARAGGTGSPPAVYGSIVRVRPFISARQRGRRREDASHVARTSRTSLTSWTQKRLSAMASSHSHFFRSHSWRVRVVESSLLSP